MTIHSAQAQIGWPDDEVQAEEATSVAAPAETVLAVENAPAEAGSPMPLTVRSVKLRALNKVTARFSDIEAPIGQAVQFDSLEIVARKCWESPPEEQPENAALLDVWESVPGEPTSRVFYGWMFSSSPSLSAMEHAVYDVTVLECTAKPFSPGE